MAKMRAAAAASDFSTAHVMAAVIMFGDPGGSERGAEAWPAAAGIELVDGREQCFAAANAAISAVIVTIPVFTGEGALSPLFAGNQILDLGQLCAPFGERLADGGRGVLVLARHRVHYNRVDAN